ncbi:hypothetical protein GCM10018783_46140 [Streptomyces griseosporeus]|nr:hypothetical protein GCM10018783_46140 [Streptomyces griseosporeus]
MGTTAAVTGAVVLMLAGCGGDGGAKDGGEPTASASRTAASLTVDEVRRDIRAAVATGGFERLTFPAIDPEVSHRTPCMVLARVDTAAPPEQAPLDKLVGELRLRGWKVVGPVPTGQVHGFDYAGDKRPWILDVSAGSLSKEQMAARMPPGKKDKAQSFTGVMIDAVARECGASARPRP